jgi:hypothetical protein
MRLFYTLIQNSQGCFGLEYKIVIDIVHTITICSDQQFAEIRCKNKSVKNKNCNVLGKAYIVSYKQQARLKNKL